MASTIISRLTSPTSDALTFTGLSLSGYRIVTLHVEGLSVGTDATDVSFQVSQSSTWLTGASDYGYIHVSRSTGGGNDSQTSAAATLITLTDLTGNWDVGNASGEVFATRIEFVNLQAGMPRSFSFTGGHVGPTGNCIMANGSGIINNSTEIDGVRIVLSGGTMNSGIATLIGHA